MNEGLKDIKRCSFVKKHFWVLVSTGSTPHCGSTGESCLSVTSSVFIRHVHSHEIQFTTFTYFGVL